MIGSRLKVLLGDRLLCHPGVGRWLYWWYRRLVPFHGHVFDLKIGGEVPYAQVASLWWGLYQKSERRLVDAHLRRGQDVIELGCGCGVISCAILRTLGPSNRLVSAEANPLAAEALRANIDRNYPSGPNAVVLNKAIDHSGRSALSFQIDQSILGSSVGEHSSRATAHVPATTLKDIHAMAGFKRFALVCDIEGAEAGLLECEAATLASCDQIVIELHPAEFRGRAYSVEQLDRLILGLGFRQMARRRSVFAYERAGDPRPAVP